MHMFRVWADAAKKKLKFKSVGKVFSDDALLKNNWWSAEGNSFGKEPVTIYGFIFGRPKGPFPDPRSPSQPNGVSRIVAVWLTKNFFRWTD